MKQQILDILKRNTGAVPLAGKFGSTAAPIGLDQSAAQLEQLMCYRELKGIVRGGKLIPSLVPDYVNEFIKCMKEDYPEQTIRKAIEQYKNEQK